MTEHTPEKVADLIVEARDLIAHTKTYNFGMWSADKLAHEVAGKLADALEATEDARAMTLMFMHHARAERDEALSMLADIRREVEDFTQSDNDALCAIEHRLSRIPEHPKED